MAKLTIVSVSYNQEKFIAEALESFVLQKTHFDFEIIIADDCSTDKTAMIISKYTAEYPKLIKSIFREKNLGVIQNYIATLAEVKSEYVIICEGDDYFTDVNKLQKQVDFLDSHPECSICFHPTKVVFESNLGTDCVFPTQEQRYNKTALKLADLLKSNFMQTNSVMYRWRFSGDENLASIFPQNIMPCDYFLHLLHAQIGSIGFIDETMSVYRRHIDGIWWQSCRDVDKLHLSMGNEEINFYINVAKLIAQNREHYVQTRVLSAIKTIFDVYAKYNRKDKITEAIQKMPECLDFSVNLIMEALLLKKKFDNNLFVRLKKIIGKLFYWENI